MNVVIFGLGALLMLVMAPAGHPGPARPGEPGGKGDRPGVGHHPDPGRGIPGVGIHHAGREYPPSALSRCPAKPKALSREVKSPSITTPITPKKST